MNKTTVDRAAEAASLDLEAIKARAAAATDRYLTDEMLERALWAWIENATVGVTRENVNPRVLDLNRHRAAAALTAVLPDIIRRAKEEAWDEALQARAGWMQDQRYYAEDEVPNPYRADRIEQGGQP